MKKLQILLTALIFLTANAALHAQKKPGTQKTLPEALQAPKIDGQLTDPCWANAAKVKLVNLRETEPLKATTEAYMTCDANALYIAFVCHEPKPEKLHTTVTQRDGSLWQDDCVEIFVDPEHTRKNYYHFTINSKGTQADGNFNGSMTTGEEITWDGQWESKTSVGENAWYVEIALPWYNFSSKNKGGTTWGLNLCRERKVEPEYSIWSPTNNGFHAPQKFGVIQNAAFPKFAPAVTITDSELRYELENSEKIKITLQQKITNQSPKTRQLIIHTADVNGAWQNATEMEIAGGKSKLLRIPVQDVKGSEGNCHIRQEIREETAKRLVFFSARPFTASPLISAWLDHSYYTSEKEAIVTGQVNMAGALPNNLNVQVRLIDQAEKETVETTAPVKNNEFSVKLKIKSLPIGEQTIIISLMQDKRTLYSKKIILLKHKPAPYEVKIDHNRSVLLFNNQPFCPFGITGLPRHLIAKYAVAGYNIISMGSLSDAYLDTAYYNGMKVSAANYYVIPRSKYKEPADKVEKLLRASSLKKIADKGKNHPAFLGYLWDEPCLVQADTEKERLGVLRLSKVTREYDPYHAITPIFCQPKSPLPPESYEIDIIDSYWWNAHAQGQYKNYKIIDHYAQTCRAFHKPLWFMPAAAGWMQEAALSLTQQRLQTWMAIIHGANGIYYWTYINTFPSMRAVLQQLSSQLRELKPVLSSLPLPQTVTGIEETNIHASLRQYNNQLYLMAANNCGDTRSTVQFKLMGNDQKGDAEVLFEDRNRIIKAGQFTDVFSPYAVHVYRLHGAINQANAPMELAIQCISSEAQAKSTARPWPDGFGVKRTDHNEIDTLLNGGFEDAEEGQPRIWYPSCSWESPAYCSLDHTEVYQGVNSLRIHLPNTTQFSSQTNYGWTSNGITGVDLGGPNDVLRDGHQISKEAKIFKVALPNGSYELRAAMRCPEKANELEGSKIQSLVWEEHEIEEIHKHFPSYANRIKEYRCKVQINDGSLDLSLGSGSIFSLVVKALEKSGKDAQFDFGTEDSPVSKGYTQVTAPLFTMLTLKTTNGDSSPRVSFKKGIEYIVSFYAKSDLEGFSVRAIRMPIPRRDYPKTCKRIQKDIKLSTGWQKYQIRIPTLDFDSIGYLYFQFKGPTGTAWLDEVSILPSSSPSAANK